MVITELFHYKLNMVLTELFHYKHDNNGIIALLTIVLFHSLDFDFFSTNEIMYIWHRYLIAYVLVGIWFNLTDLLSLF